MTKIKKILIANRGEIACRVIKPSWVMLAVGSLILTSCASLPGGSNFVPVASMEKMGETQWNEMVQKNGLSHDETQIVRFETIADKVIAASDLSDEAWRISLFQGSAPIFSVPQYRLGAGEVAFASLSDNEVAHHIAFAVAARELKFTETRISHAMAGQMLSLKPSPLFERAQKANIDPVKLALSLPLSEKMREQANARAKDILSETDFQTDASK